MSIRRGALVTSLLVTLALLAVTFIAPAPADAKPCGSRCATYWASFDMCGGSCTNCIIVNDCAPQV